MRNPFKMPSRLVIKEDNNMIPLYSRDSFLTVEECDSIVEVMKDHERLQWGLVGDGNTDSYGPRQDYRVVRVADLLESDFPWVYDRMKELVRKINIKFEFELYGIMDDIMFMRYDEPDETHGSGRFNWHSDNGKGITGLRKISMSIGLNDPNEYEGGEFQIFNIGEHNVGKIDRGTAISFPSYRPHRVKEVTKGTRYVLVLFVLGPKFK